MKCIITLLLILFEALVSRAVAQNPPLQQPQEKIEDRVVVTTNLVQIDAIVTDKSGRQVTDLRSEDFDLRENGQVRQITALSYIPLTAKALSDSAAKRADATKRPPIINERLRPQDVRRVIAIVIDDFGLSFESIARLRSALEKFVYEHTSPTDLIAVIRASGGVGSMQQFTLNRTRILATIKRMRWYPTGRGGMSATDSFSPMDNDENGIALEGYKTTRPLDLSSKEFSGGSLGALGFVIQGMSHFPGRKSIVLISDNLPFGGTPQALDSLIDRANQHSIVISTMDARGLPKPGLTADDSQYNLAANQIDKRSRERRIKFTVQQDALSYLAEKTGGTFVHDSNDLTDGLHRIVDAEQGYYLIAYRPDGIDGENTTRTFKVSLRLKRPGLDVRTRSAFRQIAGIERTNAPNKGKEESLREALAVPFVKEDVRLKITALFTGSSQIKILIHVDARDMELTESPDGSYGGSFDLAAVAFDDNGKVAAQIGRTQALRVPNDSYERLLRDGFVYGVNVIIKRAGPYQVRVALRDRSSGRIGSDGQFVDVPDVKKTRLAIAGLILQGIEPGMLKQPENLIASSSSGVTGTSRGNTDIGPAVRRFSAGGLLEYSYIVYGARQNYATHSTSVTSQIRLFHKSEVVFTGPLLPTAIAGESNRTGIVAGGTLRLGKGLTPGEYFLQVTVTDRLAPLNQQSTEQWIDFEVVK